MVEGNSTNQVVYTARLHWVIFFWPVLIFCGMLILTYFLESSTLSNLAFFAAFVGFIWGIMMWLTYHFSSLVIKRKQVILRTGILVRQTIDIPLNKIECVDIRQSIIGSLFHYGALVITGTGGSRQYVNFIDKPLTCRRHIEQLLHD